MQHLGEIIRQVRRLRNLTQQELAGERFSKSYVSAIEHNRIAPSAESLHYFAERLGQPDGDFTLLLQQPDVTKALAALKALPPAATNGIIKRDEALGLLYVLLEQAEVTGASLPRQLPSLSSEVLASLPPRLQARYHFLVGLAAEREGDVAAALRAFESALALSPPDQQAAVLDEMGRCYFLQREYLTALGYHLHAGRLLAQAPARHVPAALRLAVELHSGDAYQALGAFPQALESYESARKHLSLYHDLSTAAQVSAGLGYLIYAVIFPAASDPSHALAPGQIEHAFQRASSFLHEGMGFYRTSGDGLGQARARLTLASLQLDWADWRRRCALPEGAGRRGQHGQHGQQSFQALPSTLLDDAAEQCRQVLLAWQEPALDEETLPKIDALLYAALASLVRVAAQRAIRARLGDYSVDAAYRERAFAAHLCQLMLDTLSAPSPPWSVISHVLALSVERLEYRSPVVPRFSELPDQLTGQDDTWQHNPLGLVVVYIAAGEVAEELGRAAPVASYAHDCYMQANQFFQAALSLARLLHLKGERDPGYLTRLYARCISLLEERAASSSTQAAETTRKLLEVLKQGFWGLQNPLPQSQARPQDGNKEEP